MMHSHNDIFRLNNFIWDAINVTFFFHFIFQCQPGLGMNVLYNLLYKPPTKVMLLGPGCSVVSKFVGQAARMWNLVVVSASFCREIGLFVEQYSSASS
jgi:hypothetical protein